MLDAIPLYCASKLKPGQLEVGSGFGYRGQNGLWLVTVAHIALGVKVHENWAKWADELNVVGPGKDTLSITLFDAGHPRFRHLPRVGHNMLKPDVIAVPISDPQWAKLASTYRLFTEADVGQVATGEKVIGAGYPSDGSGHWPQPMRSFTATAEIHPLRIRFDYEMETGFSGGPLTARGKLLAVLDSADPGFGYAWDFEFVRAVAGL